MEEIQDENVRCSACGEFPKEESSQKTTINAQEKIKNEKWIWIADFIIGVIVFLILNRILKKEITDALFSAAIVIVTFDLVIRTIKKILKRK